ncbi:MFS general substrate transporter [Xylaria bambusicola]|uniref:MFS general substrate transporter n=1 Tax=Xylaria bambusicola TaxID=326684 RepID=UPI0020080CAB|nr:MFS general substrate transporter [Xylaria bambusicola]KAI0517017.1 MFS general substrate transporter [Xylaria bambusicola]
MSIPENDEVSSMDNKTIKKSHDVSVEKSSPDEEQDGGQCEETEVSGYGSKLTHPWLCVLATFFMFVNAWGLTQVFGLFQEFYIQTRLQDTSPSDISWIGSIQVFLVITAGTFTGPLFDAGYLRPLLVVGCALLVLGMATLSIATQYYSIFLAQGVAVGLGGGLIYVPSLSFISTIFPDKTRPLAIGSVSSGGSVGGIIFAFMLRQLIPSIGFSWAVRSVALVNLLLSAVALAILMPQRIQPPANRRAVVDLRVVCEPNFLFFAIALLLNYIAFYIPAFFLPTFATTSLGQSRDFGILTLVFVSIGSFLGRTIPLVAAIYIGAVQVYLAGTVVAIVVLFAWMSVRSVGGVVAFAIIYGLVSGVLVAAPSAAMSHPTLSPTMDVIGSRMGVVWLFAGVGVLIGSPVAGALAGIHPEHIDFRPAQSFAGAVVTAASLFLIKPLLSVVRYNKTTKP